MNRPLALSLLLLAWPVAATAQLGPAPPPPGGGDPAILQELGWDQNLGQKVPLDLPFRDETGKAVHLGDYLGERPVVLSLVYYRCPMLCTISLNGLARALKVLSFVPGQEFEVLTVSFDPSETPELAAAKKKSYMTQYERPEGARGWHFLTGDAAAVDALTQAVGFRYAWDPATKQFAHPAGIVVVAPDGTISRYLFGVEYSPKDLRLALVDAAEGRLGNPIDEILLYCYQYDPSTGRYSASILKVVRLGAVLTLVGMVALILTISLKPRRERRSSEPPGSEDAGKR
jgi:protein SCO1/2